VIVLSVPIVEARCRDMGTRSQSRRVLTGPVLVGLLILLTLLVCLYDSNCSVESCCCVLDHNHHQSRSCYTARLAKLMQLVSSNDEYIRSLLLARSRMVRSD
jgi:hypothetical protein